MDVRAEKRRLMAEVKRLRDSYWSTPETERAGLLGHINNALAQLATLKPQERVRERTEQAPIRITIAEKKRLTLAAKRAGTTVADLCRSGGLLNAALILDLPKQ